MKVEHKGKYYQYISLLMDIFSWFCWLAPLTTKKSSDMKKELQRIYKEHWQPKRLQSDNGGEFKRRVRTIVKVGKYKWLTAVRTTLSIRARLNVLITHWDKIYIMIRYNAKKTGVSWVNHIWAGLFWKSPGWGETSRPALKKHAVSQKIFVHFTRNFVHILYWQYGIK